MKIAGFLLLVSGWIIVIASVGVLHRTALLVFVWLGIGVELLGFVFVARVHLPAAEDKE